MKPTVVAVAFFSLTTGMSVPALADVVVYSNNFNSGSTLGFTGGYLDTSPSGEEFLEFGGAGGSSTLTLTGLPAHSSVSLSFSLYAIGSMDGSSYMGSPVYGGGPGDFFTVNFSGPSSSMIFNQSFANYGDGETQSYPTDGSASGTGATSINALGYSGFPASDGIQDAEYSISILPIANTSGSISYTFIDGSNEGMGNEFYGIDNVSVSVSAVASAVPEPSTWAMMMLGFAGLAFAGYRRATKKVGLESAA